MIEGSTIQSIWESFCVCMRYYFFKVNALNDKIIAMTD